MLIAKPHILASLISNTEINLIWFIYNQRIYTVFLSLAVGVEAVVQNNGLIVFCLSTWYLNLTSCYSQILTHKWIKYTPIHVYHTTFFPKVIRYIVVVPTTSWMIHWFTAISVHRFCLIFVCHRMLELVVMIDIATWNASWNTQVPSRRWNQISKHFLNFNMKRFELILINAVRRNQKYGGNLKAK